MCVRESACKHLKLHHFVVAAPKAALEFHIAYQPVLVGEHKVHHSTFSCEFLYHLEEEIVIHSFWEPIRLLVSCCVVLQQIIQVVEISHEDHSLWTQICSNLFIDCLICLVFLVRWPVADPHYHITFSCLLFNPHP